MAFITLTYVPSVTTLLRILIIDGLHFVKSFSVSIQITTCFPFFRLLMWYITLTDLWILNHHCIPEINPTWSWCMILLMYCWIRFANTLLRILLYVHQWYWPVIFFFCGVFVRFWYQGDAGFTEWVKKCSFLFNFLKQFEKDQCSLFFICFVELTYEAIWSWTSVRRELLNYWFNLVCSYFLFLPDSVLGEWMFLGIYPFLLVCPFYYHIIVHSNLLWSFVFLWCQCATREAPIIYLSLFDLFYLA